MKYFYIAIYCIITLNLAAQYENDSIQWNLSSNDSVSSAFRLRGLEQKFANNLPGPNYINGYQKVTKPTAGWPLIADSGSSFIDFPFGTEPDICYDTTGGGSYCLGYAYFNPQVIKLTGYVPRAADSVIMDIYFYDTSCYALHSGNNYAYLGNIIIKSDKNIQPSNINFSIVRENQNPIEACGAGGKYSAIRLYPRTGGDFFIKNMTIAGSSIILLPIDFTSIKALLKNEKVVISWSIDNVQDLKKFVIEKSSDGQTFVEAAIINSLDNINTTDVHNWIDENPFRGSVFYRVKAFEKAGKVSVSKVVIVKNLIKQGKITIYPNPITNNSLNFEMKNINFGKYELTLVNEIGQNVFSVPIFFAGESKKIIPLPKQGVRGVYYIKIENADYRWNKKVIIF
jgi:hypothetical protein